MAWRVKGKKRRRKKIGKGKKGREKVEHGRRLFTKHVAAARQQHGRDSKEILSLSFSLSFLLPCPFLPPSPTYYARRVDPFDLLFATRAIISRGSHHFLPSFRPPRRCRRRRRRRRGRRGRRLPFPSFAFERKFSLFSERVQRHSRERRV